MASDDYRCITNPDHITTVRRSIKDKPLSIVKCEQCSGISRYVISAHQSTPNAWVV